MTPSLLAAEGNLVGEGGRFRVWVRGQGNKARVDASREVTSTSTAKCFVFVEPEKCA